MPADDRWALAFYVGRFAFDDRAAKAGARFWKADPQLRARFPNTQALTQTAPAELAAELGEPRASELVAYLRRHPEVATDRVPSSLAVARTKLSQSLAAYEADEGRRAQELALSAYLDGFEPVEPALKTRDPALLTRVETAMGDLRASLSQGAPTEEVRRQIERLSALLDAAQRALAPEEASTDASFVSTLTILLREGLEALLIIRDDRLPRKD